MAQCKVKAGICGFESEIQGVPGDSGQIMLTIVSTCPDVTKLAQEFKEVMPNDEIFKKAKNTTTYELAAKFLPHTACIVPTGILKTIEVAAGLNLPADAYLEIKK